MTRALLIFSTLFLLAIPVGPASGQGISLIGSDVPCRESFINGAFTADCIPQYLAYLIKQIFAFSGGIFFIIVLIGGLQYTIPVAFGGKEKAQATLKFGIIGMIVCGLSFFILQFIVNALAGN